jgi:hypothetical protein
MSEPWQPEQRSEFVKSVSDIIAELYAQTNDISMKYALDEIQHDEWSADMRRIDQKLSIFGMRLDRPERFAVKPGSRLS